MLDRHVEKEHRASRRPCPDQARRHTKQIRAVHRAGGRERLLEPLEQIAQVAPGKRYAPDRGGVDAGEPQLLERPGERTRKAGCIRDRLEVAQRRGTRRREGRARRDRLGAEPRAGGALLAGQRDERGAGGELREAQTRQSERGRPLERNAPCEIIGGGAARTDDRHVL
jgi:hypothetical protein